jgi:hypothetical protein
VPTKAVTVAGLLKFKKRFAASATLGVDLPLTITVGVGGRKTAPVSAFVGLIMSFRHNGKWLLLELSYMPRPSYSTVDPSVLDAIGLHVELFGTPEVTRYNNKYAPGQDTRKKGCDTSLPPLGRALGQTRWNQGTA